MLVNNIDPNNTGSSGLLLKQIGEVYNKLSHYLTDTKENDIDKDKLDRLIENFTATISGGTQILLDSFRQLYIETVEERIKPKSFQGMILNTVVSNSTALSNFIDKLGIMDKFVLGNQMRTVGNKELNVKASFFNSDEFALEFFQNLNNKAHNLATDNSYNINIGF